MRPDARTVYQTHLDRITEAVWRRDFGAAARAMHFPHRRITPEGEVFHLSPEDVTRDIEVFRGALDALGATSYERTCEGAEYHPTNPDRIDGCHRACAWTAAGYAMRPWMTRLTLRRTDGLWRCAEMRLAGGPKELNFIHPLTQRLDQSAEETR